MLNPIQKNLAFIYFKILLLLLYILLPYLKFHNCFDCFLIYTFKSRYVPLQPYFKNGISEKQDNFPTGYLIIDLFVENQAICTTFNLSSEQL